jgi:DNA-binding response OmpR family regulator
MRALADCTVLVVEDEGLIAWDIEETLRESGCARVHIARSVAQAKLAIHQYPPTVAVLDVDLGQEKSFALADMLAIMRVPFFFLTAQNAQAIPPEHRSRTVIVKPHTASELIKKILELANAGESVAQPEALGTVAGEPSSDASSPAPIIGTDQAE